MARAETYEELRLEGRIDAGDDGGHVWSLKRPST